MCCVRGGTVFKRVVCYAVHPVLLDFPPRALRRTGWSDTRALGHTRAITSHSPDVLMYRSYR